MSYDQELSGRPDNSAAAFKQSELNGDANIRSSNNAGYESINNRATLAAPLQPSAPPPPTAGRKTPVTKVDASTQKRTRKTRRDEPEDYGEQSKLDFSDDDEDSGAAPNWLRQRAAALSCLVLALVFAMQSELGVMSEIRVAVGSPERTQKVKHFDDPIKNNNTVFVEETREVITITSIDTASVIYAIYYGSFAAASLIAGCLSQWFQQPARLLGIAALVTCVLNLFLPIAASYLSTAISTWIIGAIRLAQGAAESCLCPAALAMWGVWSPKRLRSRLVSSAMFGVAVGLAAGPPLSAAIAGTGPSGWAVNFYVYGSLGALWSAVWLAMSHRWTEEAHDDDDADGRAASCQLGRYRLLPLAKSVVTSPAVAALCLASLGRHWTLHLCLAGHLGAGYYARGLGLDPWSADTAAAAWPRLMPPLVAMALATVMGGHLADLLRSSGRLTTTATRRVMNTVGFGTMTVCLALVASSRNANLSTLLLTIGLGCTGLGLSGGYGANHLDIAPKLAGLLAGLSGCVGTAFGVFSHFLAIRLTPNDSLKEWQTVFTIAAAVQGVSVLAYLALCSGELQPWADPGNGEFCQLLEDLPPQQQFLASASHVQHLRLRGGDDEKSGKGHEMACQSES